MFIYSAQALDFSIEHIGFNENNDTIILVTNNGNDVLKELTIYIDGRYHKKLTGSISSGMSFQIFLPMDGTPHLVKVCSENVCKETETLAFNKYLTPDTQLEIKSSNNYLLFFSFAIFLLIIIILLLNRKKGLENIK